MAGDGTIKIAKKGFECSEHILALQYVKYFLHTVPTSQHNLHL